MSRIPSSSKQSFNVPNMKSSGLYRAARGPSQARSSKPIKGKKPNKGK